MVNLAYNRTIFPGFLPATVTKKKKVKMTNLYPNIILSSIDSANSLTVANSAASPKSLGIILTSVLIGAPTLFIYSIFLLRTFRGKVVLDEMSY